ncbi:MAG: hypothetical protein JWP20_786 [Roseomonas sp.]|nr:hypothetical protein [Roseomonas sp.]
MQVAQAVGAGRPLDEGGLQPVLQQQRGALLPGGDADENDRRRNQGRSQPTPRNNCAVS